jgi:hypothetical protein
MDGETQIFDDIEKVINLFYAETRKFVRLTTLLRGRVNPLA